MPTSISSINVGVPGSISSMKNLSHRVNTTSNFGFCQPLVSRILQPGSKVKCDVSSFVRLAPMPCPTFGRLFYNQIFRFVPFKNILKSWDAFINGKTFNSSAIGQYIPTNMPYIDGATWLYLLYRYSHVTVYTLTYASGSSSKSRVVLASGDKAAQALDEFAHNNMGFSLSASGFWSLKPDTINDFTRFGRYNYQSANGVLVTPENADYTHNVSITIGQIGQVLLCFKLNEYGQNLRKIILGLRQTACQHPEKLNLLPFLAYYRAWFDEYYPQRDIQWENTNAFKLLDYISEYNNYDFTQGYRASNTPGLLFRDFIEDLVKCYYYDDPNYYSAHITNMTTSGANTINISTPGPSTGKISISNAEHQQVVINTQDLDDISQNHLHLLNNAYHYLNKDSVVGQDLEKSGLVHGLGKPLDTSSVYLKSARIECTIGDVFSTSDTAQVDGSGELLGSYAGKGIGSGSSGSVHFETDCFGLFVCFGSIAPEINFAQTVDMTQCAIQKLDFFHEEFDAIGMQVTPKLALFSQQDVFEPRNSTTGATRSFGYIPRYSEWKHMDSLMNGDFTRRGSRDQLLPYSLDCYIRPDDYSVTSVEADSPTFDIDYIKSEYYLPVASNMYRCVGLNQWLQNFNRIFYNEGIQAYGGQLNEGTLIDDNFIIHHNVDFTVFSPGTSLSDSFDARQEEGDGKTVSINHE